MYNTFEDPNVVAPASAESLSCKVCPQGEYQGDEVGPLFHVRYDDGDKEKDVVKALHACFFEDTCLVPMEECEA